MEKLVRFSETIVVHEGNGLATVVRTTIVFSANPVAKPVYQCPLDLCTSIFESHNDFIDQVRRFIIEKANHSPSLFIEEDEEDDDFWSEDDEKVIKK